MDRGAGLQSAVADMLLAAWREPGFCVPNQDTYPHQWLWDSCFHAVIWCRLGLDGVVADGVERAVIEVSSALSQQDPDGFVPHMVYWAEPEAGADFWGRSGRSSITQPPMYGHAIAEIARAGGVVGDELVGRAADGLANLLARPRTAAGLVPVFHPWETGCDDSARWDDHRDPSDGVDGRLGIAAWKVRKGEFVAALETGPAGQAVGSEAFSVGSIGFNALVAWNIRELLTTGPGPGAQPGRLLSGQQRSELSAGADELTAAVSARWTGDRWADDGPGPASLVRTLDAMAALLVDPRSEGFADLIDPDAFGARFGPRGVDRREPSYDPDTYWRGPAWPQLGYLMMVAADRADRADVAAAVGAMLAAGAERSGLAEFWNPETGQGHGANPQTWTGLGLLAEQHRT